jgi:signal transduction histidine kinase
MKTIRYLFIVIVIFCLQLPTNAQNANAVITLDAVKINSIRIENLDMRNIVMSTKDSIEFLYHVDNYTEKKTPFRFMNILKFRDQEYSKATNTTSIKYSSLNEENYYLSISALDTRNQWNASPLNIYFRVNNREDSLIKTIEKLQIKINNTKNIKQEKINIDVLAKTNIPNFSILSFIIGFVTSSIVLVSLFVTNNKKNKFKKGKIKMENGQVTISKDEYDRLLVENTNLKAEIAALRSQIDNMSARTNELRTQNSDLKESVDKLLDGKKEFEELQKQKDDLFTMVIHDIKNPAGLIKNLVELLKSYDLSAVEQREIIDDIVETTSRIVSLSQEVTRILALESSALRLNIEDWDIREIVKDVQKRNSIAANNKNIEILMELKDVPFIPIDPQKVDEVIDNLISNAVKFSPKKGKVKITTKKSDGFVEVSISDNGLGLSQDDISKAFQRGVKLSTQPTGNEPSSGFGLWIVKKLVEAHHGKVKITSAIGKGSTFSVLFPIKGIEPIDEGNDI